MKYVYPCDKDEKDYSFLKTLWLLMWGNRHTLPEPIVECIRTAKLDMDSTTIH
jgi:hypothetical protein